METSLQRRESLVGDSLSFMRDCASESRGGLSREEGETEEDLNTAVSFLLPNHNLNTNEREDEE